MELTSAYSVFAVGAFGGLASELLHWYGLRTSPRFPDYLSSPFYWAITIAMIGVAGAFTWINFGAEAQSLTAFEIGLLAPLILQKTVANSAGAEVARSPRTSLIDFMRG